MTNAKDTQLSPTLTVFTFNRKTHHQSMLREICAVLPVSCSQSYHKLIDDFINTNHPVNFAIGLNSELLGISVIVTHRENGKILLKHFNYHSGRTAITHTHDTQPLCSDDNVGSVVTVCLMSTLSSIKRLNDSF